MLVAGFFIGKDCKEAHDFIKGFEWPPSCTAADLGKVKQLIVIELDLIDVWYCFSYLKKLDLLR